MYSTYRIRPEDRAYIEEFRKTPIGHHSPGLQRVLTVFRNSPMAGKPTLLCVEPHRKWVLARASGQRGVPFDLTGHEVYTNREDAEWEVFKARWKHHTGEEIADDRPAQRGEPVRELPGMEIRAYADRLEARPGEEIQFKVSCDRPGRFRADIVRLICGDENPEGPGFKEEYVATHVNGDYLARFQEIRTGSYAIVDNPAFDGLDSFTVQAMVWPTTPGKPGLQALIGRWSGIGKAGFALALDDGVPVLMLGDGRGNVSTVRGPAPLMEREWQFVGASFDRTSGNVSIVQKAFGRHLLDREPVVRTEAIGLAPQLAGEMPLIMAGLNEAGRDGQLRPGHFYNGKIDSPRLFSAALDAAAMLELQLLDTPEADDRTVAAWDFSRDIEGVEVHDRSRNAAHGVIVNLPTRAMTGWNWTGEFMSWKEAPRQWGAIHFHDDDLYDAGWDTDFTLVVPDALRSGVYAARLRMEGAEDYVPFVVGPARGKEKRIAVLWSTATFMAYGNEHIALDYDDTELGCGKLSALYPQDVFLHEHREYGYSLYDTHSDGSGVFYSSRLRPLLNMRPKYESNYGAYGGGSQLWGFNADLHLIDWLEAQGFDYDVVTDEDLHREGAAVLEPYAVVLTGSHPEYDSQEMLDAVETYTSRGGRLMYLGGNGFYWRIAFHAQLPGVIEVRRFGSAVRAWDTQPGEYHNSFDGAYGGTWAGQGRPPNQLVGVAFATQGGDISSYFRRKPDSFDPRAAFVFEGIGADERIGDFGLVGGGAAGLELDRLSFEAGTPARTLRLASSENHTDNYFVTLEETLQPGPGRGGHEHPSVRGDITLMETPHGGAVFSSSSITWLGSLAHNHYDNNVSRITGNVLRHFMTAERAMEPER